MGWAADGEAGRRCASVTGTSFTSIGRDDFPCGGPSVGTCSITTPRSCGSYGAPMVLGRSLAARTIGGRSGTLEPFSCSRRRSPSWLPPGPADTPRDGTAPVRTLRYAHASRSQRVTILRRADYGSEGWGFESLRARNIIRAVTCGNVGHVPFEPCPLWTCGAPTVLVSFGGRPSGRCGPRPVRL